MRFRLNFGTHKMPHDKGGTLYRPGDIIESDTDLAEAFQICDVATQTPKFSVVEDEVINKPSFTKGKE